MVGNKLESGEAGSFFSEIVQNMKPMLLLLALLLFPLALVTGDTDWDDLWLQTTPLPLDSPTTVAYKASLSGGVVCANQTSASPLVQACKELRIAISNAINAPVPLVYGEDSASSSNNNNSNVILVRATTGNERGLRNHSSDPSEESYRVYWDGVEGSAGLLTLESPTGRGALFGAFRFISQLRRGAIPIATGSGSAPGSIIDPAWEGLADAPLAPLRIWQLWDNLDGTIERGYGGSSLLHWEELPGTLRPRLFAFARLPKGGLESSQFGRGLPSSRAKTIHVLLLLKQQQ